MDKKDERIQELEREVSILRMRCRAAEYFAPRMIGVCPNCKQEIILDGYVCFNCGYDRTTGQVRD